ncbi:DoxX family protein [Candidatus Woesearchaeota archaeon]|nr:DoxX family protein [Candidatus Woesearchaeota archaeon]
MMSKVAEKYHDHLFTIFRVLVGLLFAQHGAQKLFGWFGDKEPVVFLSWMGVVGLAELWGGLAIALGFLTRYAAAGVALLTLIIYVKAHAGNGLIPIVNNGELALMYLASSFVVFTHGGGKWSIDAVLKKR